MKAATLRLIERVERLEMTGEIGDGTVAQLHELAAMARLEQGRTQRAARLALADNDAAEPIADNGMTVLDAAQADFAAVLGAVPEFEPRDLHPDYYSKS